MSACSLRRLKQRPVQWFSQVTRIDIGTLLKGHRIFISFLEKGHNNKLQPGTRQTISRRKQKVASNRQGTITGREK